MLRIYDLLEKFASGACSEEEFEELMQLMQANENDEAVREAMRKYFSSLDSEVISEVHVDEQGDMLQGGGPFPERTRRRVLFKRMLIAACIILLVCGAYFFYSPKPIQHVEEANTISRICTPAGSKTSIVLPDGTEVWLNSFSTLTYTNAEFSSGKREVTLVGEAMFKVKHDSLHPFLVHTKNFDVTDLGTVFNVQAYPEDKHGQASLISGSIEVITKGSHSKKILLVPNQRIIIQNDSRGGIAVAKPGRVVADEPTIKPIVFNSQISMAPDTAWVVNKLLFTDESFYDLALQMQRRYNVTISFGNEKAKSYKFTGRFEEENIDDALRELQAIAPFTYKRSNSEIHIE
jgi:ferric-dicitrate binding protein FerR (iron transport regulator)